MTKLDDVNRVLDAHFPTELRCRGEVSMRMLGDFRAALQALMPLDVGVEVTLWMNVVLLSCYVPGVATRVSRSCAVISDAHDLARPRGGDR